MCHLYVEQCAKPHNITGRKRYRVVFSYSTHAEFFKYKFGAMVIPSSREYKTGVFINPTKVVKQFLQDRKDHGI